MRRIKSPNNVAAERVRPDLQHRPVVSGEHGGSFAGHNVHRVVDTGAITGGEKTVRNLSRRNTLHRDRESPSAEGV